MGRRATARHQGGGRVQCVGYESHVLAPWSVPGKSGQIRGLVALLKQATSDAHTRKSGVPPSFRSVPGPVRTVCYASICVGLPWTARSHRRSARIKMSNKGGYRSNFRYAALVTPICDGITTTDDRLGLHWSADRPLALDRWSDELTEWTLEHS